MNDNGLSAADIAAVTGNNGFNGGFGADGGWAWLIIILALLGGFNGNGFGGGYGGNNEFAWLSNGQKEIMQNTNNGFDTLHLSNQIEGTRDAVHGISNQICNSTADITGAITNGFYGAEIAAGNRQMANMQQGFNLSTQLADCCCENRLASERLNATILSENCADRAALQEGLRDVITNQTANTQRIIDEIFRDRLDEKDSKIADLQRELQMADLRASQIAQTNAITSNIYNELKNCPVRNNSCIWKSTNIHMF